MSVLKSAAQKTVDMITMSWSWLLLLFVSIVRSRAEFREVYLNTSCSANKSHSTPVNGLNNYIESMNATGAFESEFKNLTTGQQMPWTAAVRPENQNKNRYFNDSLLAYDHSRVVLDNVTMLNGSDYINANYLDGYKKIKKYIATQGPMNNTIDDFWRMVWQVNAKQVVMLTSLMDHGKEKCAKYWPESSQTYGQITVTFDKSVETPDIVTRTFNISKNDTTRQLVHYHYTSWPDLGVPNVCSLLTLVNRIRSSPLYQYSPLIVHCSAGIGRTGTFILTDQMIEMARNENRIDVPAQLCRNRMQRVDLVEKLPQYVLVHRAVAEMNSC